jgi:beta-glucanase (GH16 family)
MKSPGVAWTCTFDDEFTGTTLDASKWSVVTTAGSSYHSGSECYSSSPNNVAVANGYLRLTALKLSSYFSCKKLQGAYTTKYTSGAVTSKFGQTGGLFTVRALFPAATIQGLQSALWLYPVNPKKYGNWPRSGEIDIAEQYSMRSTYAVPTVHYIAQGHDPNTTNNYCAITPNAFHTYTVQWTATSLTFSYDGSVCLVDTLRPGMGLKAPAPFDQPFVVNLTEALGISRNGLTPKTPLPASTYIDYVRVWK